MDVAVFAAIVAAANTPSWHYWAGHKSMLKVVHLSQVPAMFVSPTSLSLLHISLKSSSSSSHS